MVAQQRMCAYVIRTLHPCAEHLINRVSSGKRKVTDSASVCGVIFRMCRARVDFGFFIESGSGYYLKAHEVKREYKVGLRRERGTKFALGLRVQLRSSF